MGIKPLRVLTPLSLFIRFLLMFTLGILVWTRPLFIHASLYLIALGALVINALSSFAVIIFQRNSAQPNTMWTGVFCVLGFVFLLIFPKAVSRGTAFVVGLWSLLVALVQLSYILQLIVTRQRGSIRFLLSGCFSLAIAFPLLVDIGQSASTLRFLSGFYLCSYGLWQIVDILSILFNRNMMNNRLFRAFRLKPPVILTAMLPSVVLKNIEKNHKHLSDDMIIEKPTPKPMDFDETLEVFFHLGHNVAMGFGHVDIALGGMVYSYGCYDAQSNRLNGLLSDGTILTCDRDTYMRFCLENEQKVMVSFALGLSHEKAEHITATATEMLTNHCEPWKSPTPTLHAQGATFYRLTDGPYKIYNVFRTNCAAVAELIASQSGLSLLPPSGFITPGAYFDFLLSELREPNSNVIRETIYTPR